MSIQVTVSITAKQFEELTSNVLSEISPEVKAELITRTLAEVIKSPAMIEREFQEEAKAIYDAEYRREEYVSKRKKQFWDLTVGKMYTEVFREVYNKINEEVLKSKEMDEVRATIAEHFDKHIRDIMVDTFARAILNSIQANADTLSTVMNNTYSLHAKVEEIRQKLGVFD